MVSFSKGLELSMLGAGGLGYTMDGGAIYLYSGTRPASASAAVPHQSTLIGMVTTQGYAFYPGSDFAGAGLRLRIDEFGNISNYGQWVLRVTATGSPSWFRWKWAQYDDDAASFFYPRIDGGVSSLETEQSLDSAFLNGQNLVLPFSLLSVGQKVTIEQVKIYMK